MAFDFTMAQNFTVAGQMSFFQMPYIQAHAVAACFDGRRVVLDDSSPL